MKIALVLFLGAVMVWLVRTAFDKTDPVTRFEFIVLVGLVVVMVLLCIVTVLDLSCAP
jgi:hypothetical protein